MDILRRQEEWFDDHDSPSLKSGREWLGMCWNKKTDRNITREEKANAWKHKKACGNWNNPKEYGTRTD